jgi:uncharacterized protein YjbI with pentapeptide repeats
MKIEIRNRFNAEIIFSIETDSWKLAVEAAIKAKADLRSADLRSANLRSADLSSADLRSADLRSADLRSADLRSANLRSANLSSANLRSADLRSANLRSANLSSANLRSADLNDIRNDFWSILLFAQPEIAGLRTAIVEGRIDGSVYKGECACLVGTIANVRKCDVNDLKGNLEQNSSRPAERFFMGISKGDKPENNPVSKIVLEWLDQFAAQIK